MFVHHHINYVWESCCAPLTCDKPRHYIRNRSRTCQISIIHDGDIPVLTVSKMPLARLCLLDILNH